MLFQSAHHSDVAPVLSLRAVSQCRRGSRRVLSRLPPRDAAASREAEMGFGLVAFAVPGELLLLLLVPPAALAHQIAVLGNGKLSSLMPSLRGQLTEKRLS